MEYHKRFRFTLILSSGLFVFLAALQLGLNAYGMAAKEMENRFFEMQALWSAQLADSNSFFLNREPFAILYDRWTNHNLLFEASVVKADKSRRSIIFGSEVNEATDRFVASLAYARTQSGLVNRYVNEMRGGPSGEYLRSYGDMDLMSLKSLYTEGRIPEEDYIPVAKLEEAVRDMNAINMKIEPVIFSLTGRVVRYQRGVEFSVRAISVISFFIMILNMWTGLRGLHDMNRQLESVVSERTAALRHSLEERERMQGHLVQTGVQDALGRMVIGLAHELNTPLGTAYTALCYGMERIDGANSSFEKSDADTARKRLDELREGCDIVRSSLGKSITLVKSMMQLTRFGEYNPDTRFSPAEHLTVISTIMKPAGLKEDEVTISSDSPVSIPGDGNAFSQVVLILLENAGNFARMADRPLRVSCRVIDAGGKIRVTIADNGPGFPDVSIGTAFMPFSSSLHNTGHAGLGLFIGNYLVTTILKGTFSVKNADGGGAVVTIELDKGEKT